MSPDAIFLACNLLALCGWIALLSAPRRNFFVTLAGLVIPLLLSVTYCVVLVTHWRGSLGNFNSLDGVSQIFTSRWLLLAGWIHYLAFDLFIGSWEHRDARAYGVPYFLLIPCLVLTFLFGPAGLLLYLVLRRGYVNQADPGIGRACPAIFL
jgi:hypothetical protein